jgi:polyisoprenoid-binding protein YceI
MHKFMIGLGWLFWTSVTAAAPVAFELDPVHTQIFFTVDHAGFSSSTGKLLRPTGELLFDAKDWSNSSVSVSMLAANVEFDDAAWNKAVQGKSYFDVVDFPQILFRSTQLRQKGANSGELSGELTLLGVTREVQLRFTFRKRARHPYTLKDTIGFDAEGTLSRADFGMTATPKTIGDRVLLRIALEAVRKPQNRAQTKK